MRISLLAILLVACAGCGPRGPKPGEVSILRTYGWETTVIDPQAEWNPTSYQVLARTESGFSLLEEGGGKQEYFGSKEGRTMYHASWLSGTQFVFGPRDNVLRAQDGTVVPNSEGLQVVSIRPGRPIETKPLSGMGWRPRRWRDRIVAQAEDRIFTFDTSGKDQEFGRGFLPEPQPDGQGIAFQETPVFSEDLWTAKPRLGALIIRWKSGKVTTVPGGVHPRWTKDGGLFVEVLDGEAPTKGDISGMPSHLVYYPGPDEQALRVGKGLRDIDPHPTWRMIAAIDEDQHVMLVSLSDGERVEINGVGARPRWSADGHRLLIEEPLLTGAGADQGRYLRVLVLGITGKVP